MKLLIDQNLSFRLKSALSEIFEEILHVREIGLDRAADELIWEYAREHGFAILTKDSDFQHRSLLKGFPPKVIQLRYGNTATGIIYENLASKQSKILDFLHDENESLLILG